MFMAEVFPSSRHRNTIGIFGWLVFGVAIWDPVKPDIYCLPRVLLRMATFWKSFQTTLYFGNVEVAKFSDDNHLPSGIIFMEDIWPSSIQNDKCGTLG